MLDPRLIRTNPELVREKLSRRKEDVDLDNFWNWMRRGGPI